MYRKRYHEGAIGDSRCLYVAVHYGRHELCAHICPYMYMLYYTTLTHANTDTVRKPLQCYYVTHTRDAGSR